ncbi:alpha-L-fucosidase [Sphingomonas nostoxanthinifaciens]|uniref:alpha-L-fucosidase n=1 Tax=Sphingomonas nostoxanthinifaciens TaxID=2872652 RepID=UPI001CC1E790|nr:alpha-L-fucosidase [Sphingomonas nostoxanthinifaciens]UAK23047.1 alpha-L-fucosidase [Sphingomonas nostoxanthinifaciens]
MFTRRQIIASTSSAALIRSAASAAIAPDWRSLAGAYRIPDWFRDAKFGIWAHWGAQAVPQFGDWYGRLMYVQGNPFYDHHVKTYGHPSRTGFMEIENLWKAEHWEPATLVALYKKAGARYFMSLACHHDNLDTFDSAHHEWNALRVGPKRDIVGGWEKVVRAAGLRFGVSNHSSHAWHWWQTAYGYDSEGPMRGVRYDAARLRKDQGAGTWWEGLDPQDLYTGPYDVPPDGIRSIKAMNAWHEARDGVWREWSPPGPRGAAFTAKWLARQKDLVAKYRPDMVYFDDYGLPLGQAGIDATADFYNRAVEWHGAPDVVVTAKQLSDYQRSGIVEDVERGFAADIKPHAWQTDTCIGSWFYDRPLAERHGYKSAKAVVQRLCDVVSKNGNLMLSVPLKADGTHDSDEMAILADLARWFAINGDGIYGTRPWRVFGEGPNVPPKGMQSEDAMKPYTAEDVRITAGGGGLNLFLLDWPSGPTRIACLGRRATAGGVIERVTLNGGGTVPFEQSDDTLILTLPAPAADAFVPGLRIEGRGLV